jgi:uncharacterized protein VirK/YbjX
MTMTHVFSLAHGIAAAPETCAAPMPSESLADFDRNILEAIGSNRMLATMPSRRTSDRLQPSGDRAWSALPLISSYWRSVKRVFSISRNKRAWRTLHYMARCAAYPWATLHWLDSLDRSRLNGALDQQPRLLLKPYRPYVSKRYDFRRRSSVLLDHYAFAAKLEAEGRFVELLGGRTQSLAAIMGKRSTQCYQLSISKTDKFDREGEVILSLRMAANGSLVQAMVFNFAMCNTTPCIEIGCVQGDNSANAQAMIKLATKALHGIRPKNLLLHAIYALADVCNVQRVFGISNASRVFRSRHVHANYDSFWVESGGVLDRDGFFLLPRRLLEKANVPSHRRAEYRRRAELRTDMCAQIRNSILCSALVNTE